MLTLQWFDLLLLPGAVRSTVMSMFVCLYAQITRKPHGQTSPNSSSMLPMAVAQSCSVDVAICCVLPVFVDAVIFSHNAPVARHVYSRAATEHDSHNRRNSIQILLNDNDQEAVIVSSPPGLKSAMHDCVVVDDLMCVSAGVRGAAV